MTSTGEQGQRPKTRKPPHYFLGLLLSGVLPGAGFSYLGQGRWHLGWFVIMAALLYLAFAQMAATSFDSTSLLTLIPIGWAIQLLHTTRLTCRKVDSSSPMSKKAPIKCCWEGIYSWESACSPPISE